MSKHLVIGSSGLVGDYLTRVIEGERQEVVGTYHNYFVQNAYYLDVNDTEKVKEFIIEHNPDVIYLPAALSNVDYCESNPNESYAINVVGVLNVAQALSSVNAKLVYFSSDYIFDGKNGPYSENDPASPISEYGRHKLFAEHYIALNVRDYLIIRTTVVYGWERQRKNFIYKLFETLHNGFVLKTPIDQIGTPTYAHNLAEAVFELVQLDTMGVYNIVGRDMVNRYKFACEAARVFGLNESLITGVNTSELPQVAQRPLLAGLSVEKVSTVIRVPLLGYREGLRKMAVEENIYQ